MINVNFAYNENLKSAINTLKVIFLLDSWFNKNNQNKVKTILKNLAHEANAEVFLTLSARSSLNLLLKSLELSKSDKVIVQAFTCEAVILPIINNGLKPLYIDIEESSFSMDFSDLDKKINDRCKVLILQHSFGMTPIHREKVLTLAAKKQLIVIEDLAHGFYQDVFTKDNSSTIKLFSFGRSKLFSVVHGGAIVINDKTINDKFAQFHSQLNYPSFFFTLRSLLYKILSPVILQTYSYGIGKLLHKIILKLHLFTKEISAKEKSGFYDDWLDKKLPNVFCKLLINDLLNYQKDTTAKTQISGFYYNHTQQKLNQNNLPILRFPILVENYKEVTRCFKGKRIFLGNWYNQVVAPVGLSLSKVYYTKGLCPRAEEVCSKVINLPTNLGMNQAKLIINNLRECTHEN